VITIADDSAEPVRFEQKRQATAYIRSIGEVTEPDRKALFDWVYDSTSMAYVMHPSLRRIEGYQKAKAAAGSPRTIAQIVRDYRLSWEMVPDSGMNEPKVWEALLDGNLPLGALIRQLPRLTRLGMLSPMGSTTARVCHRLTDPELLAKARIHPINLLVAARTYASGQGARSEKTWTPSRPIVDALDAGFYAAYGAVTPTNKRLMLALDCSGSMTHAISGLPITAREAAAAIGLVTANVESSYEIVGFTAGPHPSPYGNRGHGSGLVELSISPRQRLDDVLAVIDAVPFGGTNCALPMLRAIEHKLNVDAFVIYTDNETWHGDIHPFQALQRYREVSGIDAKLVVVSLTANGSSIANPDDPGMLDVSGFDSAVPNVISDFARGL
jgi:60 kDa SS-A/Ro ribonucleoprotein